MAKSINVTYTYDTEPVKRQAYTLTVEVVNAVEMPAAIFMFQAGAGYPPGTAEQPLDVFVCVADPIDLEEIPVDAPDLQNEIPYYRKTKVTLKFRSLQELVDTKTDIAGDIATLVTAMNAVPATAETITYD